MERLIHNCFLAGNIASSVPILKLTPKGVQVEVLISPLPYTGGTIASAAYIQEFLRLYLQKVLNRPVTLHLIEGVDLKIWGDRLAEALKNPAASPTRLPHAPK